MSAMPRLIVVDDDPFTLTTLTSTFQSLGLCEVIAVRTAAEAISALSAKSLSTEPVAAVLDLDLGEGPTGIDLAHRLRKIDSRIGIVILSTYVEPRLIGSRQSDLPSRALYLVKQSIGDPQLLRDAVLRSVDRDHSRQAIGDGSTPHVDRGLQLSSGPVGRLRDNQVEIMRLVSSGLTNAQIAQELLMKERAVEKAVARLIKQLGIPTSREYNQRVLIAREYHRMTRGLSHGA